MRTHLPPQLAISAAIAVSVAALVTDIFTAAEYCPPILYVIALAICVWVRDRRALWALALSSLVLTFVGGLYCYPPANAPGVTIEFWINRVLVAVVLVSLTLILDGYIGLAEAYRRRNEELAHANDALERARRSVEEASARKMRFMAAISHDIRTPANAIRMLARLILHARNDPTRVEDLTARLESSAAKLTELLTDVLDVARFDSEARMAVDDSDFPVSSVLADAAAVAHPLAETKGLRLVVRDDAAGIMLRADRARLTRVVVNLLDNAIKFTDAGVVSLDAAPTDDGGVHIRVGDTGPGIAPENLGRIFDEFFQVRRADRDRANGHGLGLATCKRLVESMQGRIDVESRVGGGTRFTIAFPAARVRSRSDRHTRAAS